jgi:hypothetical protein
MPGLPEELAPPAVIFQAETECVAKSVGIPPVSERDKDVCKGFDASRTYHIAIRILTLASGHG